jgi:hypothetical protein
MNTQTTFAKVYKPESDKEIIKKNGLRTNPEKFVEQFVKDLDKVKELARLESPQEFEYMSDWAKQFNDKYNLTYKVNPVTPLLYLVLYCKETNTGSDDLFAQMIFLPKKFQIICARHFVTLR